MLYGRSIIAGANGPQRQQERFCRPPKRWQASILPFPRPALASQGKGENISKAMKAASGNADSGLTLYLTGPALWKQGEEPGMRMPLMRRGTPIC